MPDGSHGKIRRNHRTVVGAAKLQKRGFSHHGESSHCGAGVGDLFVQLSRPLDGELLHTQFNVQQVAVVPPVPECGVVVARVEGAGRVVGAVAGGPRSAVSYDGESFAHVQVSVSLYAACHISPLRFRLTFAKNKRGKAGFMRRIKNREGTKRLG